EPRPARDVRYRNPADTGVRHLHADRVAIELIGGAGVRDAGGGRVREGNGEKLLVGGRVPAGVAVGLGGQGDDGGDHFGSVAAAEGGGLGALQIRQQIVGDGRQIVLPQRRIACRLAGGIPHYLLHFRDAADFP